MDPERRRFLVWGGGGHGKVVADLLGAAGHQVIGFVDRDEAKLNRPLELGGADVVLGEGELLAHVGAGAYPEGIDAVALAIGDNGVRQRCLVVLGTLPAPPLVHPRSLVSPSAVLGRGTVVLPGAVVNAGARIGAGGIINSGVIVEHDCSIADAVHVSPGAVLSGGVHVGERSWIGAGATVIQGIKVGADAIVGAGAVVIRDVPDGATVVGVPARPLPARP